MTPFQPAPRQDRLDHQLYVQIGAPHWRIFQALHEPLLARLMLNLADAIDDRLDRLMATP